MRFDLISRRAGVVTPSLLIVAALMLSACADPRRALGLQKESPDEFAVVARAPLNLPPDYTLRPPRPGAPRPNEATPREQARAAIFKVEAKTPNDGVVVNQTPGAPLASPRATVVSTTPGEAAVLGRAGADGVQADIRTVVDRESAVLASADSGFIDRLLSFTEDTSGDGLVDAEAEARRLKQNQALGLPATDGETPRIERKTRNILDLF